MPKIKTKIQNPLTTMCFITLIVFDDQILLYTVFIFFFYLVFLNFTIVRTKASPFFLIYSR